ncbi:LysR family transcriptional regulator [Aliiglaciecola sp. LCG003]|uniref:LysR family transcriptional regulator n=1 Tax=Aliiglaciecola sp. LCG003 TaxID=3053655 RepID=UPI0025739AC7|nr:LysR family transcriptional regulator [Aliiglaciecola sp. LCG003]WJG08560.1 LysR family transcriptional regulator [Aliiglaciecola sp. LCG003]
MSKLDEMRVFVTLIETQSATRTAEKLGVANSAVSRRMKDLEQRLGVQLVKRTTRKMNITLDGELYFARCKQILDDLEEAERQVMRASGDLSGNIKIATPLSFGIGHLSSAIAAFMHLHEKVNIDLDMSDRRVDIVEEGFDLALRIGNLDDSSLRARKLSAVKHVVCCSPSLLKGFGPIQNPNDLKQLPALCYSNIKQPNRWRYTSKEGISGQVSVTPRLLSSNGDALRDAAIAGLGVVCEPTFICHTAIKQGLLVPVLTDYQWFDMNLYALYPQTRYLSARTRTLIDFLAKRFGDTPYWDSCFEAQKHNFPQARS